MRTLIAPRSTLSVAALGLMALAAYLAFGPIPANACGTCECTFASQCYSNGACRDLSYCSCTGDCSDCRWLRGCPPIRPTKIGSILMPENMNLRAGIDGHGSALASEGILNPRISAAKLGGKLRWEKPIYDYHPRGMKI